jgi:hypothetical protein
MSIFYLTLGWEFRVQWGPKGFFVYIFTLVISAHPLQEKNPEKAHIKVFGSFL